MKIKFEVIIESGDQKHVKAMNAFMKAVSDTATAEPEEKKPAGKKPKEEKPAEAPEPAEETTITVKDLRALISKKVEEHRKEIKAKLEELGANNVSSLEEDDYEEFMEFLNDLD